MIPSNYASGGDEFGYSVTISDNHVAVGSPNHNRPDVDHMGSVYVYRKTKSGDWLFEHKLSPPPKVQYDLHSHRVNGTSRRYGVRTNWSCSCSFSGWLLVKRYKGMARYPLIFTWDKDFGEGVDRQTSDKLIFWKRARLFSYRQLGCLAFSLKFWPNIWTFRLVSRLIWKNELPIKNV